MQKSNRKLLNKIGIMLMIPTIEGHFAKLSVWFFIAVVFYFCAFSVSFAEPIVLSEQMRDYSIGLHLDILEDPSGKIVIADLANPDMQDSFRWTPSEKSINGFGFTTTVYWIRFAVENPFEKAILFYLVQKYPMIDHIDLYIPRQDGEFTVIKSGDGMPFTERKIKYRDPAFSINMPPLETRTFYLRYQTTSSLNMPLVIHTPSEFLEIQNRELPLLWMYYGLLISMIVYNLFLFVSVRDINFLYYVCFLLSYLLFQSTLNGLSFEYLWPNAIWWANNCLPLFMNLTFFGAIRFASSLLDFKRQVPKMNFLANLCMLLSIFGMVLSMVAPYRISIIYSTGLCLTFFYWIFAIIYLAFQGTRTAIIFTSSYLFWLIGISIFVLKTFGILPHNTLTQWSIQIGSAVQSVLLAIILTDQINTMKNKLQLSNINLEHKVEERTKDLKLARDQLWGEMELAKKIQTVLLPDKPTMKEYDISCFMGPADSVGGDYYDIINAGNRDWIIIGDVSGHGVSAGLIMMMAQTAIHTVLRDVNELSPKQLLDRVNFVLTNNIKKMREDKYMTITVFACHENGNFTFSGLHQDIVIFRNKSKAIELIETRGLWIGVVEDFDDLLNVDQFNMEKDDIMFLYTDGITEAKNEAGKMYSDEKLIDTFKQLCDIETSSDGIKNGILNSLKNYTCEDDVTMVILKKQC
jgi:serine phosphatase RsbU (regulator of sigma subunit)